MNKSIYRLIAGFRRFREKYFLNEDLENSLYQKLASTGQTPKTMLIGCSDSRVDPAILTDAAPGELFVVRNVANLVPPCEPSAVGFHGTSSALEFAVEVLKVENIIVLGHRQCGGIRALMQETSTQKDSFISQWMSIAKEAKLNVLKNFPNEPDENKWKLAEMESIKVSLKNLKTFPFIAKAIEDRGLKLLGIYFDLEMGQLWEYDETTDKLRQLEI